MTFRLCLLALAVVLSGCMGASPSKPKEATNLPKQEVEMEEITVGEGPKPGRDDLVWLHYKGTLKDGTVFVDTYAKNKPIEYSLGEEGAMRGLEYAIQEMQVGGKYKVKIPPSMGYGDKKKDKIPPNSWLYYEMEIGKIEKGMAKHNTGGGGMGGRNGMGSAGRGSVGRGGPYR